MQLKICKIRNLIWLVMLAMVSAFASSNEIQHDNSRISIFVQPSISFLSFSEREYFQDAIDTIYHEFLEQALDNTDSLNVAKQDFQKVNFCFPISAGLQFQVAQDQFISAGIGFIYDNESVVLADRMSKTHNYSYTIQGVPLFLEYRFAIPTNLMSLSNESLFSIALRWYWALPGTEIYTTWGKVEAENPIYGSGFGLSVGYLIASWKNFNVYGDLGFSSISVKSKKQFADIVPDGPEEKAKWDVGGIQLQIRVSFGVWNKPEIDTTEYAADSLLADSLQTITQGDSLSLIPADTSNVDSATAVTDTTVIDSIAPQTPAADSVKTTPETSAPDSTAPKATVDTTNATPVVEPTAGAKEQPSEEAPKKEDKEVPPAEEPKKAPVRPSATPRPE